MSVRRISIDDFKRKFKVSNVDPWNTGVFTDGDLKKLQEEAGVVSIGEKIYEVASQSGIFLKDPIRIIMNFKEILREAILKVSIFYKGKYVRISDTYPFSDYTLRARIVSAFKPKRFLEIGTGHGWGITAFKSVLGDAECITMSPKWAQVGQVFKKKKLAIKQIWSDSLKFDFSTLGDIDVSYIDGNHSYKWVYSDLVSCSRITKSAVMLDDYIPSKNSSRGDVTRYLYFNKDIVKAVSVYLQKNPKVFKYAYWLKKTNLCILIK